MKRRKRNLLLALLGLLILWCLWYSRPVDIHVLLGQREAEHIGGLVIFDAGSPWSRYDSRTFDVEGSQAEALMKQLETLRFRRSPLGPLLRLLPIREVRTATGDREADYHASLTFWSRDSGTWEPFQLLDFWMDRWSCGPHGDLPLHISHGREQSQALGRFLWEMAGENLPDS